MEKIKNIFYFRYINQIGGIETFFYELAKKYKDWDIVIYYQDGDWRQIERLRKYVRVVRYTGETIECEKAFFNFNLDIIDKVKADEYIQIAHGDYKAMRIKPNTHPKINRYLGVSKQVCETYKEVTGYNTELTYNPFEIPKPRKVLKLISATRLTSEKGKDRMKKLAEMLDEKEIPYTWEIFTDDINAIENNNIVYRKTRLNIDDYIAGADYLVQLSDNEGYCYSVIEALSLGVPVIVTDIPVLKELGVKDRKNGFILPFDMSRVPIDEIYEGLPAFKYVPKKDNWMNILAPGPSKYDISNLIEMVCVTPYHDLEMQKTIEKGDVYRVTAERAEVLIDKGVARKR